MEYRTSLPEDDLRYMPLHRTYQYKRNERLLIKYAEKTTWFKGENLGDPFKRDWLKKIKFKWTKGSIKKKENRLFKLIGAAYQ